MFVCVYIFVTKDSELKNIEVFQLTGSSFP